MDELDQNFIDEVINMRLEIAYKRKQSKQTRVAAKKELDRDERIDEIYNSLEEECTERGKKLLLEYSDEIAYRESDDADFYYESGFLDGVALIAALLKIGKEYC